MEIPFIQDLVVIFCLAIFVVLICHRARISSIVGFLFTGILSGPQGLGLIENVADVEIFSKVGIVLLLFTIGVEFSLKRIFRYTRYFLLGGSLQVAFTVAAGFCIAQLLNRPIGESLFLGFLLSLSSTTIVFRLFEARSEIATTQGRLSTAILIFQDLIVVAMMLMVPFLAGAEASIGPELGYLLLKSVGLIIIVIILATKVIPRLFYFITLSKVRELFLFSVLAICLSVGMLSEWIGLSISIGAFLAGLIVSESEYSHQAIGDIIPLQDIFTSFFFVSIGMLLDPHFLLANLLLIIATTAGIMLLKWLIVCISSIAIGVPLRTASLTAFAICQIGEFSFVLAKEGVQFGIGNDFYYQLFLAATLLSMSLTPFLMQISNKLTDSLMRLPIPIRYLSGRVPRMIDEEKKLHEHVIIVGFGLSGQHLAKSCRRAQIPYIAVDMNTETVHQESEKDEPILFGDATHSTILRSLFIQNGKVLAISINDPLATIRIIHTAKKLNPTIYIICRTRYLEESKSLFDSGADEVIPDELGASIEMLSRVLTHFQTSHDDIERIAINMRNSGYERFSDLFSPSSLISQIIQTKNVSKLHTFHVEPESFAERKTIGELHLHETYGALPLLIRRREETITKIENTTRLYSDDRLLVSVKQEKIAYIRKLFTKKR